MDSHPSMPASATGTPRRNLEKRVVATPYMSERQTQAYLLARDVVRRVQRTSPLMASILQNSAATLNQTQGRHYQGR